MHTHTHTGRLKLLASSWENKLADYVLSAERRESSADGCGSTSVRRRVSASAALFCSRWQLTNFTFTKKSPNKKARRLCCTLIVQSRCTDLQREEEDELLSAAKTLIILKILIWFSSVRAWECECVRVRGYFSSWCSGCSWGGWMYESGIVSVALYLI